jgi:hypothetical protein
MEKLPVRLVLLSLICCPLFAQVAQVRHAPTLNGTVLGSVQQMTAENTTLNGNAAVSGDLLLPGTPAVQLNGNPTYGGTLDGIGAVSPTNHKVTLNGSAILGHVVRRTDAISLPVVAAPPAPTGTTTLSLSAPGQTVDWPALRNLILNSGAGQYAVPPGSYGDFTANGSSSLSLGVVGATTPSVYNFQNLTLNGSSRLEVVGPVILTLANAVSVNGSLGSSSNPSWLVFKLASGGLTLNGGVSFYGYVTAPSGTVALNGNSQLVGGLIADRLTLNGNSLLHLLAAPTANVPPTVTLTAPTNGATYTGSASFTLAATAADTDGTVSKVEFYQGTVKLGEDTTAPYTLAHSVNSPGVYTYVARATDNQGATGDSAAVTITVTSPNQPPTVALTAPADGTLLNAPADVLLTATASDPDGSIGKVEFYQGTTKLWEDTTAPYEYSVTNLAIGTYSFSARAFDLQSLATTSASVAVTVVAPNVAPTVALTAPLDGASFTAPATFTLTATAADSDGLVTKVEFFQGASKVGEDSFVPYELTISGLTAGSYSYVARATDNTGSATDSAPVTVSVTTVNTPPTVVLTAPATGTSFTAPATILLSATAADSDGTITKVEFYQGTTKLGESLVAPYEFSWLSVGAGTYSLTARATDNQGASTTSAANSITVNSTAATLPFVAEFEPTEGYVTGPLAGQKGWTATTGIAVVASSGPASLQEVTIAAGQPPASLAHDISAAGATPVFVDFFARPVAGVTPITGVTFNTSAARVALVGLTSPASLQVFDGNVWLATGKTVAIDASGRTVDWLRLTTREDYGTKKWDLYSDGRMIIADVPFADNTATSLTSFSATGHATVVSSFDDFYAGLENPIAADADHDGMDDAWETAHGLNPSLNDRNVDLDADGLTNVQEYVLGSNPNNASDADNNGLPDSWEQQFFGHAGINPTADSDGDGVTNAQEYAAGSNPVDYYNGRAFSLGTYAGGGSSSIAYTYDASGRVTLADYGAGKTIQFAHSAASNLTAVTSSGIGGTIVTWRTAFGLPADGTGTGADTAVLANDGLPNLAKYAFGLAPAVVATGEYPVVRLTSVSSVDYLILTYSRPEPAASDLTYRVEVSSNGTTWTSGAGATVNVSTTINGSTATVVVRDATPVGSPNFGRRIRLMIERRATP